jgi:uncharacterized protein YjbI with pentapeptide repeats
MNIYSRYDSAKVLWTDGKDADLRRANLTGADLAGASLACANLRRASLAGADLAGADLTGAKTEDGELCGPRPIIQIGPIGSRQDYAMFYTTDKGLRIRAGCFFGDEESFRAAIINTHADNQHAREYLAGLEFVKLHMEI